MTLIDSQKPIPYVGFPIIAACGFNCMYCLDGGEASVSTVKVLDVATLEERVTQCMEAGITRFRITGGEPLLHPKIKQILEFLSLLPDNIKRDINTAGYWITRMARIIEEHSKGIKYTVSLDSLNEHTFNSISGTDRYYRSTLDGIEFLASKGLLTRLNMMALPCNVNEVNAIIEYCRTLGCGLKISETAPVLKPRKDFESHYQSVAPIEESLAQRASRNYVLPYARDFGIPTRVYEVDGVSVIVKGESKGARFNIEGVCGACDYAPWKSGLCREGLYFISALADGGLSGCRFNGCYIEPADFPGSLRKMINTLQNTTLMEFI
ncbi:MAG: radical SAM protein [archaeon]